MGSLGDSWKYLYTTTEAIFIPPLPLLTRNTKGSIHPCHGNSKLFYTPPPPPKKNRLPNFVIFQTLGNFCFSLPNVLKSCLYLPSMCINLLNRNSAIQSLQKGLHYYVQPSEWSMQGPADRTSSVTFFSNIRLLISSEESSSQFLYAGENIFDKHQKTSSSTLLTSLM